MMTTRDILIRSARGSAMANAAMADSCADRVRFDAERGDDAAAERWKALLRHYAKAQRLATMRALLYSNMPASRLGAA